MTNKQIPFWRRAIAAALAAALMTGHAAPSVALDWRRALPGLPLPAPRLLLPKTAPPPTTTKGDLETLSVQLAESRLQPAALLEGFYSGGAWQPPDAPRGWPDAVADAVNPFTLVLNKVLGVSHRKIASEGFFADNGRGAILGLNGVAANQPYQKAADYMSGHAFADAAHIRQARIAGPGDFIETVLRVYRETGPLGKLVLAAHGSAGSLSIGDKESSPSAGHLDAAWARANAAALDALPVDLFAPGASIALISCSTAQGFLFSPRQGTDALRAIFGPLLKQGGTIIAARRYVDPELGRIPKAYKTVGDRLNRHTFAPLILLVEIILWAVSDWKSKISKLAFIEVPARGR